MVLVDAKLEAGGTRASRATTAASNRCCSPPTAAVLVTSGADGTVRLHDVNTGNASDSPHAVEPDTFAAAVLAPDGSRLFAVSDRHGGLRLDISPQTWKRHACLVAGRDLTAREWQDALPGQPHRTVCRRA